MKVLKEGTWNTPWVGNGICPTVGCGAELEVYEKDLRPAYRANHLYECVCCICGHVIPIPAGKLPLRVRKYLESIREFSEY